MTRDLSGARAVVLGLGHFGGGLGVARWLVEQGARVTVTDRAGADLLAAPAAELAPLGVELVLGGHEGVDFGAADLLVVNPAVPWDAPPVATARAAGVEVTSEMALLLERWPGRVLGITGSNGKTTTCALAHALLQAARVPSVLGGNMGGSLLGRLAGAGPDDIAVVEISSFMLEVLAERGLGPDVAVITNITPNHLDRHASFEAYREAKAAILERARYAVLFHDDPWLRERAADFHGQTLWFGGRGELTVDAGGNLLDRFGGVALANADNPLRGRMNRLNLAAALLGVTATLADEVRAHRALPGALELFQPAPQRLQVVATADEITWINDSASTTPESTAASLEALEATCLLIAGGHDKGLDASVLVEGARGRVRLALTLGEQAEPLAGRLMAEGIAAEALGTLTAAVARAARLARPGEVVLLSPGYSSHDQFTNFAERGEAFRREVERVIREGATRHGGTTADSAGPDRKNGPRTDRRDAGA